MRLRHHAIPLVVEQRVVLLCQLGIPRKVPSRLISPVRSRRSGLTTVEVGTTGGDVQLVQVGGSEGGESNELVERGVLLVRDLRAELVDQRGEVVPFRFDTFRFPVHGEGPGGRVDEFGLDFTVQRVVALDDGCD